MQSIHFYYIMSIRGWISGKKSEAKTKQRKHLLLFMTETEFCSKITYVFCFRKAI